METMNWYKEANNNLTKKPKVLMVSVPKVWGISKDLNCCESGKKLNAISDFTWIQGKDITQEDLAEHCRGFDHLMLNIDALKSYADKMERIDKRFYEYPGVKTLKSLNQDMTDFDFFSPIDGLKNKMVMQYCPNTTTESVAESTITEILLHATNRHLSYKDGEKLKCRTGINLKGKTAGIIGYGNIGKRVGEILKNIGMNVLVYDINPKIKTHITPIKNIFKEAQVISIHIPTLLRSGRSNIGFIDSSLLDLCSKTILINLATDEIVNPISAANALKSQKLIAYSTQHNYSEEYGNKYMSKLKSISGFHESPCSFNSIESQEKIKEVWIQNTISMIEGNPLNVWS